MTVTIELTPEEEATLRAAAAAARKDLTTFARERLLGPPSRGTLAEAMLPFQQAFAGSGMTEAEADELIDRAKREYREERRRGQAS